MTRDTKPLITERVKYEIAQNRNSTKYNQAHTTRPYGGAIGKTEIPQGSVPVCLFPVSFHNKPPASAIPKSREIAKNNFSFALGKCLEWLTLASFHVTC